MYKLASNLFCELWVKMADVLSSIQKMRWGLYKSIKANGYRFSPKSFSEPFLTTHSKGRKINREYQHTFRISGEKFFPI